ncbi:MAG: metal ABC transporter solute-binding protein, Zn/Mn family [Akkermansiaceae bacterium]
MAKKVIGVLTVFGAIISGLVWLVSQEDQQTSDKHKKLVVVTTTTMVTDMVQIIGGDRIMVQGLMGPGVDPHSYQVTFRDTAALQQADVIFYSGQHLEGKMQKVLEKRAQKHGFVFALTDGIDEGSFLMPEEDFDGYYDPHVWGDPKRWAQCIKVVVDGLSAVDPDGTADYQQRAKNYHQELQALDKWVRQRIASVPSSQRVLVTSHDAFHYLGEAYGIQVKGLQGISTNSESGLKDRAELVAFIKQRQLKTIFPESSVNAKGIKAVAAEAGVQVSESELFSDAMGKPGDVVELHGERYDKGTYIGMIKHNVNTVVDGLQE